MGSSNCKYIFFLIYSFFYVCCNGQTFSGKNVVCREVDSDILLVDTIIIKDPILIRFKENQNTDSSVVQSLLVSASYLDTAKNLGKTYLAFLLSNSCYFFFTASRFSCIISNQPSLKHLPYFDTLQKSLQNSEKDNVWVKIDKNNYHPKKHLGWEYNEIYSKKFALFLVKGSAIRKCQSIDEIVIENMDNTYFKLLVPITR